MNLETLLAPSECRFAAPNTLVLVRLNVLTDPAPSATRRLLLTKAGEGQTLAAEIARPPRGRACTFGTCHPWNTENRTDRIESQSLDTIQDTNLPINVLLTQSCVEVSRLDTLLILFTSNINYIRHYIDTFTTNYERARVHQRK